MGCGCNDGSSLGSSVSEINTQTCLPTSNCPQATAPATCGCGCSPCQCGQRGSLPTPYYNQAPGVEECHKQVVIQQSFVTAISTVSAFNIPACNQFAVITIPGLTKIQVGSYIWNVTYGYLLVTAFDYLNQQITVKNECTSGNAAPGTAVPACTMFNVVDPPGIGGSGQIGVFLATDFVAPDVGNCIDINVTSVAGLTVGANVQVSSGIYRLSAIVSPTIITICNDGSGVVHGTVVVAKDGSGQYIVPITPLSSNACTNPVQTTGAILTCHNGVQAPLDALAVGQIPVVVDAGTNEVEFQTINIPVETCTTMTGCLNLVTGTTQYTIVVLDSSVFFEGELLVIHVPAYETARWEVIDIPNPTHIVINKTTPQTEDASIGCDTALVCAAPCCEQITSGAAICDSDWSKAFKTAVQAVTVDENGVLTVGQDKTTVSAGLIITNPTCNPMSVMVTNVYTVLAHIGADPGGYAKYIFTPNFGYVEDVIGGVLVPTPTPIVDLDQEITFGIGGGVDPCAAYSANTSKSYTYVFTYSLPANKQLLMFATAKVAYTILKHYADACCHPCGEVVAGDGDFNIDHLTVTGNLLGVSIQAA